MYLPSRRDEHQSGITVGKPTLWTPCDLTVSPVYGGNSLNTHV